MQEVRTALRQQAVPFVHHLQRRLAILVTGIDIDIGPADAERLAKIDENLQKGKCPSLRGILEGHIWDDEPLLRQRVS